MLITNIKTNKENFIKELNNDNFPNEIFNWETITRLILVKILF